MKTTLVASLGLIAGLAIPATQALAQDLQVKGGSSYIIYSENNTTTSSDKIAVYGKSKPVAYYGVGAQFEGGYRGVRGYADMSGTGSRIGGYFIGSNGASTNYGVYASASGPTGSTNYAGYFSGNVYVTGTVTQGSDERLKLNIKDLGSSLDKIRKLKPKTYNLRNDMPAVTGSLAEGTRTGFLAQELREVFPEMVKAVPVMTGGSKDDKAAGTETSLSVNYIELIPVLVKAIQEQQAQIDDLKARVAGLEGR